MKHKTVQTCILALLCLLLSAGLLPAAYAEDGDIAIIDTEGGGEEIIILINEPEPTPEEPPEVLRPFYIGIYSWLRLELDRGLLEQVGHQTGGQSCACFALAYCRTLLDGKAYSYSDFNMGRSEYDAYCNWYAGSYDSYSYTQAYEVYERIYRELCEGHPTALLIHGSATAHHYVAVVGFEQIETGSLLGPGNFVILDPCAPDFEPRNMGAMGYRAKRSEDGTYQLLCDLSSAEAAHEEHRGSSLCFCRFYDCGRLLTAKRAAVVRSLPCTTKENRDSKILETVRAHSAFRATELVRTQTGEYWYRGVSEAGTAGYVMAFCFDRGTLMTDPFTAEDLALPAKLGPGEDFALDGALCAGNLPFSSLRAEVWAEGSEKPVLSVTAPGVCRYYPLAESALTYGLPFARLRAGTYRLALSAEVESFYSTDGKTLMSSTETLTLAEQPFTVTSDARRD